MDVSKKIFFAFTEKNENSVDKLYKIVFHAKKCHKCGKKLLF